VGDDDQGVGGCIVDLFPFQLEDVEKLADCKSRLIQNEMGTGKTYEAIALDILARYEGGGFTLVVAPLSTHGSWEEHFHQLTNCRTAVVDPKDRMKFLKIPADVYIVHWDALRLIPQLKDVKWLHVIVDECHRSKNRKAAWTKALFKIHGTYQTALSGTPVVNKPSDFWPILHWLFPSQYTSYWNFVKRFEDRVTEYVEDRNGKTRQFQKVMGPKNEDVLRGMLEPITTRRLKKDVLKDLPDKYYTTLWVDLTPEQRAAYRQMKKEMIAWVGRQQETPLVAPAAIAKLVRLQQFALAYMEPVVVTEEEEFDYNFQPCEEFEDNLPNIWKMTTPSSKLQALLEWLDDHPDEPVVIFSQFKQFINLIVQHLKEPYSIITGDIAPSDRTEQIRKFQQGRTRIFVGTIGAGGIGITLTAASTVIFTDRTYSPALNAQAEDRLHRIGQKSAVQVIDIMARSTVDIDRTQKLELKWTWIRRLLGDDDALQLTS
jgi:SNF2 family DNA or RNA helicase